MILLVLAISFPSVLQAQSVSAGFRGGVNLAKVSFEGYPDVELDGRPALDIGMLLDIKFSDFFSVQPEIHYLQKGFRFEEQLGMQPFDQGYLINYLEVPILAKFSLGNEMARFLINAGPSLGYALKGKYKANFTGDIIEEDIDFSQDLFEDFNRVDFSLLFGAGISFNTGSVTIFADARYLLGLRSWGDIDDGLPEIRNRGLGFGLGVLIPVGE
jgi:hypothetical protein